MAARFVVLVNGTSVTLRLSYCFGTARRPEYLETLKPEETYKFSIRDDGTHEKIEVDYLIVTEGSEHYEPTNVVINADTMSTSSEIRVVDSGHGGEARLFSSVPTFRDHAHKAGFLGRSVGAIRKKFFGNNSQDIPR